MHIAIAIAAAALCSSALQDDVEGKKKRLAQIIKEMFALEKKAERSIDDEARARDLHNEGDKIMKELTGGAREKEDEIVAEVVGKYAPELKPEIEKALFGAREKAAMATLRNLSNAQEMHCMDRGRYWTADVSGLHRAGGQGGYINKAPALADAKPCVPLDRDGECDGAKLAALAGKAAPLSGYWLSAVAKIEDGKGEAVPIAGADRYAICAYPAEYGKTGRRTLLLEGGRVWKKDTGGKPVEVVPAEPKKAGWEE